jgi:hypothetical protein
MSSTIDPAQQQAPQSTPTKGGKGLAIAALVLGIFSLLLCWVPILNNIIIAPALVGTVLGVIGYLGARKGKRGGKGMSLAGVILSVLAIILIFVTQAFYVKTLDDVSDSLSPDVTASSAASASGASTQDAPAEDASDDQDSGPATVAVGDSVTVSQDDKEAATILVSSVKVATKGSGSFSEKPENGAYKIVKVTVTNTGSDSFDVNPFDWYYRDADGNKYEYGDGNSILSGFDGPSFDSTTLQPGEKRSGSMVFDTSKGATELIYAPGWDSSTVAVWKTK